MTFLSPAGIACDVQLVITNPDGQNASRVYNPTPAVTNSVNSSGPAAGGTTYIILGSGFGPGTSVTIGGNAATVNSTSGTFISCTTPAGVVGPATVVITTPNGCQTTTTFTYN
jgi:hypothetical protein